MNIPSPNILVKVGCVFDHLFVRVDDGYCLLMCYLNTLGKFQFWKTTWKQKETRPLIVLVKFVGVPASKIVNN